MANHAKRREAARLLKGRGLGKLYRGNKRNAWQLLRADCLDELIYKLQFRPGQLVNDCDGFNHVIRDVVKPSRRWSKDWLEASSEASVLSIDQFELENGSWSCGCPTSPEPAKTQEAIEKDFARWLEDADPQQMSNPVVYERMKKALQEGRHICDEQGKRLPEFREGS